MRMRDMNQGRKSEMLRSTGKKWPKTKSNDLAYAAENGQQCPVL